MAKTKIRDQTHNRPVTAVQQGQNSTRLTIELYIFISYMYFISRS